MSGDDEIRTRLLEALEGEPVANVEVTVGTGGGVGAVIRLEGMDADQTRAVFERHRTEVLRALSPEGDVRSLQFDLRTRPAHLRVVVRGAPPGNAPSSQDADPPGDAPAPTRAVTTPVMTRLDARSVEALDLLVEAGLRGSRSDAVAWCVHQTLAREAERIAALREPVMALRRARVDLSRPVAGAVGTAARQVLERAEREARDRGYRHVGTEHLFLALLSDETFGATALLTDTGVDPEAVRRVVERAIPAASESPTDGPLEFTPMAARVVDDIAMEEARRFGDCELAPEHLLLGLVAAGPGPVAKALGDGGADLARLRVVLERRHKGE